MHLRLRKLREVLGLKSKEFAKHIGRTDRSLYYYETGERRIDNATALLICKTFNVNENWLFKGEGDIFLNPNSEENHNSYIRYYERLDAEIINRSFSSTDYILIPLLKSITCSPDRNDSIIIDVIGNSMYPTLYDKDKILLDIKAPIDLIIDKIYLIMTDTTLIIKRFGGIQSNSYIFNSDNPQYQPIYIKIDHQNNRIIGLVKSIIYRQIDLLDKK